MKKGNLKELIDMIPLWIQYSIAIIVLAVVFYFIGGFVYLAWKQKKFFFQKKDDEPKNRPTPPRSDITCW